MGSLDDNELVSQVAKGNEQAFLALYDRYVSRIYALALNMLGDPMLAEEVTQDTFLKLWGRARLYLAERSPLLVWLLTIARHTALDRLRLESRRPLLSDSNDPETFLQSLPDAGAFSEEQRWRVLYFAVQSLPPEQRQVIELAYYQGMSQSEIAAELNWPLGTVKTRMRAALEALRKEWNKNP